LSLAYSLVLPATAVVKLRVATVHEATLSIDGHINPPLADGAVITVKNSATSARFLRLRPENAFYSTLERKLKGKH
jgi:NAD+ kinase